MKVSKNIGLIKSSKLVIAITCFFLVISVIATFALYQRCKVTSLEALYKWEGTVLTKADPLIVMGDPIVPTLIEEIKNKEMPKRMVVIYFLGDFGYQAALPVLESILQDETEHENVRAGVLYTIYQLDIQAGVKYAQMYQKHEGIGKTARSLLEEGVSKEVERRSYTAAVLSYYSNGAIQIQE